MYKDRLVRFGFEVIDHSEQSKGEELTEDLIRIITVFANGLYGQRSKKTKRLISEVRSDDISDENKAKTD